MDDNFCVAISTKTVSALLEIFLEVAVVVDFSIENDEYTLVFVENGLVATGKVCYSEATHPQGYAIAYPDSLVIRAAVSNNLTHRIDKQIGLIAATIHINKSRDPTHLFILFISGHKELKTLASIQYL